MVLSSFFGKKPPAGQGDGRAAGKDVGERLDTTSTLEITNLGEGRALAAAAGKIQVSAHTKQVLDGKFYFDPVGVIDIKNIGPMETFYLTRKK